MLDGLLYILILGNLNDDNNGGWPKNFPWLVIALFVFFVILYMVITIGGAAPPPPVIEPPKGIWG